ncbi:MAG: NAD(P)H-dependent oxidoreductase [Bacteroidetes bacterium]|nr:NAD(P)H-dependent oxidoreductase [Bacteroidota bacterium]
MPQARIVGIAGSLRKGSYNRALLRAAIECAPEGMTLEELPIDDVPLYNADIDIDGSRPVAVERLKERIRAADGVLLVSPEYSHGVPGVLKNALDWASRKGNGKGSPMAGKPVGIIGASTGGSGTMRGQEQLKLVVAGMLMALFPHGGVVVPRAGDRFDDQLRLSDDKTREFLGKYLDGLLGWVRRFE